MQDDQLLADIGPEVLNGNAALWLGPAWQILETNIAMRMSGLSWLAIWSESNGAEFASKRCVVPKRSPEKTSGCRGRWKNVRRSRFVLCPVGSLPVFLSPWSRELGGFDAGEREA